MHRSFPAMLIPPPPPHEPTLSIFSKQTGKCPTARTIKNALQLFFTRSVRVGIRSDTYLMFRLKCPTELASFNYWGRSFYKQAPL